MKKTISMLLLICMLACMLCTGVLAAGEPTVAGIYDVKSISGVTITPLDKDENVLSATTPAVKIGDDDDVTDFYGGAVKLRVTYSPAEKDAFYLVLAMNEDTATPTAEDIIYIDQDQASSGSVVFDIYPAELQKGEYFIYLSSNASSGVKDLTQVASFKSYVPYKLGDADGNQSISVNDALYVLQAVAHTRTLSGNVFSAADADKNGSLSVNDALYILQAVAHTRTLE